MQALHTPLDSKCLRPYSARQVLKTQSKAEAALASDNVVFLRPLFQWSGVRLIQHQRKLGIYPPTSAGFERPTAPHIAAVIPQKEQKTMQTQAQTVTVVRPQLTGENNDNRTRSSQVESNHGDGIPKPYRCTQRIEQNQNASGNIAPEGCCDNSHSNSQQTRAQAPNIKTENGKITTSSFSVADFFGKEHRSVLRAIRNLECSPEYRARNFAQTVETRKNPSGGAPIQSPAFQLTKDGFVFLAMGFTGKEAAKWKEAYIEAFNAMEAALSQPAQATLPEFITAAQAGELATLIAERFPDGRHRPYAWSRFNNHFRLSGYKTLPASKFADACDYIRTMPGKNPETQLDSLTAAFMPPDGRYLVLIKNGKAAHHFPVPEHCNVMGCDEIAEFIRDPGCMIPLRALPEIVNACMDRLGRQLRTA